MTIKSKLFTKGDYTHNDLNILYDFYKKIWSGTFEELNSTKNSIVEDFHRFDVKVGFFDDNFPVAFHGYQFFDLDLISDREHAYFSQVNVPLVKALMDQGIKKISTLEYMCICPDYRKNGNKRIGEILGGFSTQYFIDKKLDGVITITRNDRGVNRMCRMYGGEIIYEALKLHNVEVDIALFRPGFIKPNPDPDVQNTILTLLEMTNNNPYHLNGVAA
ncbi:MAG: hypothetical protein H6623_04720 [Bdellovibrionaceae bacterium]|nr:hypothetical protein [Pseudobdellovibrionaceae bacterium]